MKKAKVSKYGQWKYPGEDTIIPNANGSITMKGVPYPVLGIDDQGNQQMMMPGVDYQFPGNSVYEIPMAKKGGAKKVKIKSLPKAQVNYNPQFETSYDVTKSYAENIELNKRAKQMGWNSVDDYRQSGWGQKPVTKDKITEETKEVLNTGLNAVADWEKNWYSKRAQLPQFTEVANKRLGLIDKVNTNLYNDKYWSVNHPDASGTYNTFNNAVNLPAGQASNRRLLTHERSHWYDFNAPQNPELEERFFEWGSKNVPHYNYNDRILNNILPVEYTAFGFNDPLHRPNTKNKQYNSEIERILDADAQWEPTNNESDIYDIQAPFETEDRQDYLYSPTEVRARLNEWRREFNIDPTKNYSEKEFQQIIDNDLNSGGYKNNDFYKLLRGRGDLLKKIHDAYVSTGNKENPDEMPKAQDGLPADYESFLKYSETAPENRRPDSEWQYGNPRQYDHYGMWDALGKPKNFEEALANYPQWQPDPYDGMYHGFSTNPNTGVWLKSHIPGESHPGDTGWMEYKDFMLSNDRNWGGKNQNLVYDPDLQRMRYVDREKQGGTIKQVKIKSLPKAQIGFLNNVSKQFNLTPETSPNTFDQVNQFLNRPQSKESAPGIFDEVNTRIEDLKNAQPTTEEYVGGVYDQYKKILEAGQPKEEPVTSFTIPEDYYTRLMQEENSLNKGLRDGRYYQHPSLEKGTDTIGYGHKLTEQEQKSGKYSKGLTKEEAIALMRNDVQEHLDRTIEQYNQEFGKGTFDKLHPDLKVLALDYVYNGIPIEEFPNFFGAANKYSSAKDANAKQAARDEMLKQYLRHGPNGVPLRSRNEYTKGVLTNLKQKGGLTKKKKQPGFQVLTDANGKYVFVKT